MDARIKSGHDVVFWDLRINELHPLPRRGEDARAFLMRYRFAS